MIYAPYFSLPLLALIAFAALFRSHRLIEVTAILCVFPVASAIDFSFGDGLFSITPCLLAALLLLPCALAHGHSPGSGISIRMIFAMYSPLAWFTFFAVLSSVLAPFVLAGEYQTAQTMDRYGATPLAWGRMNVTQSIYIVVLTTFAIVVSCELAGRRDAIRRTVNAFIVCGYLAGLIAAYHFMSARFGWYFPFDVLYSRPEARDLGSYSRQFQIGGVTIRQVFGSFSEPSTLAQFMLGAAFGACYWWMRGGAPRRVKGLAILSVATLLATVSSTAYAGLAIGAILLGIHLIMSGRLRVAAVVFGLVIAIAPVMVWAFDHEFSAFRTLANNVMNLALFTKRDTISFQVRWLVDSVALDAFLGTYGLGIGWGSTRGSSLFIHLLGNVGVIGIFLLTWFAWKIRRRLRGGVTEITGFIVAVLCGNLLGGVISVPDINSVAIWLLVGLAVASALTPRRPARRPVRLGGDMRAVEALEDPFPVAHFDPSFRPGAIEFLNQKR